MLARNVTTDQILSAARRVGVEARDLRPCGRTGVRFVLRPVQAPRAPSWQYGKYYRRGFSKKTVSAVCWHGHRDFFRALFQLAPEARIQTAHTREIGSAEGYATYGARGSQGVRGGWYTAENFEREYTRTGDTNIGSQVEPMYYSAACYCDSNGLGVQL